MKKAFLPLLLALLIAPAAAAQTPPGTVYGALYGGHYVPDSTYLGEGALWGVLAGYRWERTAVELSLDRFEGIVSIAHSSFDARLTALAVSGVWIPNPGGRPEILLLAGFGRADVARDGSGSSLVDRPAEDSAFLRAGAGLSFPVTGRLSFRPQVEARWFGKGDNPVDVAATLALGWRF